MLVTHWHQWFWRRVVSRSSRQRAPQLAASLRRRLLCEPLEDRRLLTYAPTDLGVWQAYGLNNNGQVVGAGPSIWQNGIRTSLGGATGGTATAINDAGQVAGYFGGSTNSSGFLWDSSHGYTNLGGLPNNYSYSQANDLNEAGQVVGLTKWSTDPYDNAQAFLWDSTTGMQALQSFDTYHMATAINESGQIVGWSQHST